jgi:Flp pilus assembly pilin Flp
MSLYVPGFIEPSFGSSRAYCASVFRKAKTFRASKTLKRRNKNMKFSQFIKNLHREESGQDLLEYALVLAAVLAAVVVGNSTLATSIKDGLTTINTRIQTAVAS